MVFCRKKKINMTIGMVNYSSHDSPYRLDEQHSDEYSPNIVDRLRSSKAKIRICKEDNEFFIRSRNNFQIIRRSRGN